VTPNIVYLHSHDTDVDPLREAIFAEMNDHLAYKLKRAVRARTRS